MTVRNSPQFPLLLIQTAFVGLKCIFGKSFQLWSWSCQEGGRTHPFSWWTWPVGHSSTSPCFRSTSELTSVGFSEPSLVPISLWDWKKPSYNPSICLGVCPLLSKLFRECPVDHWSFCVLSWARWGEQVSLYVEIGAEHVYLLPGQQAA